MSRRGFTHEKPVEGETVEWFTPPEVFDALGISFNLDPCAAPKGSFVPADHFFTKEDDGLSKAWFGRVWLNPPYGKETAVWLDRLIEHGDGIALVFARTDPAWAQRALAAADLVCFVSGRIRFINGSTMKPAGTPGAGSMLLAFGEEPAAALQGSGLGILMRRQGFTS